jgi:hypothetical protein
VSVCEIYPVLEYRQVTLGGVLISMAAIANIRWDNLGGPIEGCIPIYDVDRNSHFFYLKYDGMGTYVAELIEGLGFEESRNPGPFRIPWSGPYSCQKASDIVRWFLSLVGAQVGHTSRYEAIISYVVTMEEVKLAACVSRLLADEFYPQALPQWFVGSLV